PLPRPRLQGENPLVPRPTDAARRARHDLPARAYRHPPRTPADPRRDAGRLPHRLHRRPARGRDPGRVRSHAEILGTFGFTDPVINLSTLPGQSIVDEEMAARA